MNNDPELDSEDWSDHTFRKRVLLSKSLLYIHGFLSEAENQKIQSRIDKWLSKWGVDMYGDKLSEAKEAG